jgi:hypothetical protein
MFGDGRGDTRNRRSEHGGDGSFGYSQI